MGTPKPPSDGPIDWKNMVIPLGFVFAPTPPELIWHFLRKKILGEVLPVDIPTINLYGLNPYQIPMEISEEGKRGRWHFYTYRPGGDLITEGGYWLPTSFSIISCQGRILGFKQVLTFFWGMPPNSTLSCWTIKEYRAHPNIFLANEVVNDHIKLKVVFTAQPS